MALTRYLHFVFTHGTNGTVTGVGGIEVYDASSVDLTIAVGTAGATAESSENSATYTKTKAFDHDATTAWRTVSGDPGWIRYDLGAVKDVRSVVFRNWNGAGEPPQSVTVYGSQSALLTTNSPYGMDLLAASTALTTTADTTVSTTVPIGSSIVAAWPTTVLSRFGTTHEIHTKLAPATFGAGHPISKGTGQDYLIRFGGPGYIAGTVDILATPSNTPVGGKRVALFKQNGTIVSSQLSASDGSYRFNGLDMTFAYFVVAFDDTFNYNAVIKDNIVPVLP